MLSLAITISHSDLKLNFFFKQYLYEAVISPKKLIQLQSIATTDK